VTSGAPLYAEADVAVVGGGPAGLAAAASAARGGARTLLVERYGFLGGMGTAGGVTNFAGLYGRVGGQWQQLVRGVADELLERIDALGGLNAPQDGLQGRIRVRSYDTSAYKCAADALMADAGVQLLFHALVTGVVKAGAVDAEGERIDGLVVHTRSGPRLVRARVVVDASGDADVAALAGVPFEVGDGAGSGLYPTTMFRIAGVDPARALAAIGEFKAIDELMAKAAASGQYRFPRRGAILRPQLDPTEWRANVTQLAAPDGRALNALDAAELSRGEVEGRRQIVEYMRFLRAEVPGFEKARITEIAPQVGVRETRRIAGAYALSGEDILSSARFEDRIGINAWPMELHAAGRIDWGFPRDEARAFNDLPLRMLLPQGRVGNLLVAGRCASMTHEGQSAARASGGCFVMGQAAGTAAAQMLQHAGPVAWGRLDITALQDRLRAQGAVLDVA
jgi:hypothetical protein